PGPSPLNRPHPPHSPTHRDFTALRLIRDASSLRVVPCFRWSFPLGMPSSTTPGSASAACAQFLRRRRWPSSSPNDSALPSSPTIRFKWASHFGATSVRIATACRVACLPGGSDRDCSTQPTETFTSGLSTGRSPFPPPDITTVPTGRVAPAGLPPAGMSASIAALGEGEEVGLVDRVQDLDDGALDDLVFERGNAERPLPPVRLRDETSKNRPRPVRSPRQPSGEILEILFQPLSVVPPCLSVDPCRGVSLTREVRFAQAVSAVDVVQERREPLLPFSLSCLSYPLERTLRAFPALSPGRVLLGRIPLGQPPSLHRLRGRFLGSVRRLP